ncbi:MAG TPA: YtxH domain-containing protein [Ktedonobacterales bacterium]|nr:YtxH domain-containing protein [Ktedonobacterales bacterium]
MAKRRAPSGSGFWSGVLLGIAIGATIALLFGPQNTPSSDAEAGATGRPSRELLGRLRDRYREARSLGTQAYRRGKEEVLASYARAKSGQ